MNDDILQKIDAYQEWTETTATYPKDSGKPLYPCMGLMGEAGELIDKLKKIIRGDKPNIGGIKKEIGDVLWYTARFCEDSGYNMSSFWGNRRISCYFGKYNLLYFSASLFKSVASLCELVWLKNEESDFKERLEFLIGKILGDIDAACELFDYDVSQAMKDNQDKINSRKARDVIKGSGDER